MHDNKKKSLSEKSHKGEFEMMATLLNTTDIELEGKVKVSSKGQIVIPIEVRRAAGIKEGEQELRYHYKDGKVILEVEELIHPDELFGFFNTGEKDFVLDMRAAREERAEQILNKGI